jgi:hypothetical protein
MKNPLFQSNMFVTPDSIEELYDMIDRYSGNEKSIAYMVCMFTMNLCHNLVEKELNSEK